MKQLIAGVSSHSIHQYLQNQFLVSCSQLCKSLLSMFISLLSMFIFVVKKVLKCIRYKERLVNPLLMY